MEATVGRNEPCPCGSGKKYKRCHGDPTRAVASVEQRTATAGRLMRALYDEGAANMKDAFTAFMEPLGHVDSQRLAPFLEGEQTQSAAHTYALFDLADENGRSFADRYRARRTQALTEPDDAYIDVLSRSVVDLFEVVGIERDRGLSLRNLRTGADVWAFEENAPASLVESEVIATRVIETEPGRHEVFPPMLQFEADVARSLLTTLRERIETSEAPDTSIALKRELPQIHAAWIDSRLAPAE